MLKEEMLLKKNWLKVKFSPDINRDFEMWDDYIRNGQDSIDHYYTNISYEEWSEKCYEKNITEIYVFKDDFNEMFIEQYIEEELYDDFYWKCEIVKEGLDDFNKDKLYYCDEDYDIINVDYNLTSLIA